MISILGNNKFPKFRKSTYQFYPTTVSTKELKRKYLLLNRKIKRLIKEFFLQPVLTPIQKKHKIGYKAKVTLLKIF